MIAMIRNVFREFRDFAIKGNMIDLAVGIIIGAAFGGVVTSLVQDVLMPPIGRVAGNLDFSNLYLPLSEQVVEANKAYAATQPTQDGKVIGKLDLSRTLPLDDAKKHGPVIAYGKFITNIINFIIVTFCVFLLVKAVNTARRTFDQQQASGAAPPPRNEVLLGEIRDLLKDIKAARP
jgi:large conductance mechanosensitive channel